MRERMTTREVAKLMKVKPSALKVARESWGVEPLRPGHRGPGNSALWSPMQALTLLAAKGLRLRGVAPRQITRVVELLWSMAPAELQTTLDEGRTHFCVVGEKVLPRLVCKDAILDNESLPYATLAAMGVRLWGLNLGELWGRLKAEIAKLPEKKLGLLEEAWQ